ncbi:MAG: hypothetical protein K2Y22_06740 [Candidatus Obscuribacterales bacterium]|nr:hypothetical protein [Candidatus Obscuribacterales bacterium]
MKGKIALATLALMVGLTVAPNAALAKPSVKDGGQTLIACPWAKWFMDERRWEYGHRNHDHDFDFHSSMIHDDDMDMIADPPPMKTVEVWKGNKKEIHIVPSDKQPSVVIFGGGKTEIVDPQ